jgi:hypothetical protein
MNRLAHWIIASVILLATTTAHAVDSVSIEAGRSFGGRGDDTNMGRIGVQWDWNVKWFDQGSWYLTGYWDLSLGYWNTDDTLDDHDVVDIGITPTFRLRSAATSGFAPYVELAVGAHYLSDKDISDRRRFSTNFQFGDHIGLGFMFGDKGQYDLSYRLQHLSNASIDSPNPGINFNQIRFQYRF